MSVKIQIGVKDPARNEEGLAITERHCETDESLCHPSPVLAERSRINIGAQLKKEDDVAKTGARQITAGSFS